MRLGRVYLIKYGHFTDRTLELPVRDADFHIIFGPNEAGKSTALVAIEDLLFGILRDSRYNFLHDYKSMRIGALLENNGETLEVWRRKGNKDTLLDSKGLPIAGGENVLRPYLAGANRPFFVNMFNLDHTRLREGGKEILAAENDIGQILFAAGTGISGLRQRLKKLDTEADNLWGERHAKHRKFYEVKDKLEQAKKKLHDHTITPINWQKLKHTYEKAKEEYDALDDDHKHNTTELSRLNRIQRVFSDIRRKQGMDNKLKTLANVIVLPEDAGQQRSDAELEFEKATARIETLQKKLTNARRDRDELHFDEGLVQRENDILKLDERRIKIHDEKEELLQCERKLHTAENELNRDAKELGWTDHDIASLEKRVPQRKEIKLARELFNQGKNLEERRAESDEQLEDLRNIYEENKNKLDKISAHADVSKLNSVIKGIRKQGDIQERLIVAAKDLENAKRRVSSGLASLSPNVSDEKTLIGMNIPVRQQVQDHYEREREWQQLMEEIRRQVGEKQQERDNAVGEKHRVQGEQFVSREELDKARKRRNTLWSLVKAKLIDGKQITEDQVGDCEEELDNLSGNFEHAIEKADDLADRMFNHAEAAGKIAVLERKITELESEILQAQKKETNLIEKDKQLKGEWSSMWHTASVNPLCAEAMLVWLDNRDEVLEAVEERDKAKTSLESLRHVEQGAKEELFCELQMLGVDVATLANNSLNSVLEFADDTLHSQKKLAADKDQLEEKVEDNKQGVARQEQKLQKIRKQKDEWSKEWGSILSRLGLGKDTEFKRVSGYIDIAERMHEYVDNILSFRGERDDKAKRAHAFESDTTKLVKELKLTEELPEQAAERVVELKKRLDSAKNTQIIMNENEKAQNDLIAEISDLEKRRDESTASISYLKKKASVGSIAELEEAINKSNLHRSCDREREKLITKLQQDVDGKSLQELEEECQGIVIDDIKEKIDSTHTTLGTLQQQKQEAFAKYTQAQSEYQKISGESDAALAEASKQEALAEMQEVAERYVQIKTSAILLQWAIDRYRQGKQAPLLTRAGELFKIITENSFSSLRVDFDEKDKPYLTGMRHGGEAVPVDGMSTGTTDQLYLALRVAAIEDYLQRANSIPFIADDLFINFDDARAAEGFRLLEELSQKTQVLFFTHHRHLVDIARKKLGNSISFVSLMD